MFVGLRFVLCLGKDDKIFLLKSWVRVVCYIQCIKIAQFSAKIPEKWVSRVTIGVASAKY